MKKMDILAEDKEILVINKPAKLLTIATDKEKERTLYHEASVYLKKQNPKNRVFIVHRLDKDTSGIVVFAKNEKAKFLLQKDWENGITKREYIAIVEGKITKKQDTIVNYLIETKTFQVFNSNDTKNGKKAITHYEVMKQNNAYTMLKITIETGRKNQIRVALSSIGHPIIGDKKYHAKKNPLGRLGLHAHKLEITHPLTKKKMNFEAKMPKEFIKIFETSNEIENKSL